MAPFSCLRKIHSLKKRVVVAGGAVLSALTGCSSGRPRFLCLSQLSLLLRVGCCCDVLCIYTFVLSLLLPAPSVGLSGDVDLFLVGVQDGEEPLVLSKIYDIVMRACKDRCGENAHLLVTRSMSAVTFFGHGGAPIQVILSTYNSTEDLLVGFDIDAACCAYVLDTSKFFCLPRGRLALEYHVNTMQSQRHSRAYFTRLEKYALRGHAIGLPGLDTSLLSPDLLQSSYVWIYKRDLLLRVLSCDEDAPGLTRITMPLPSGSKVREVRCKKQRARRVSGVQRLVVLTLATNRIRKVDIPHVARSAPNSVVLDVYLGQL